MSGVDQHNQNRTVARKTQTETLLALPDSDTAIMEHVSAVNAVAHNSVSGGAHLCWDCQEDPQYRGQQGHS
eukprot:4208860-Amphidinium_carterae.1